ncbi:MAG: hypothetical protein ACM34L_07650 [Gemmatimonas sp.]|nr:hypothetical protein [Gemmatimonadaceae bacterium]
MLSVGVVVVEVLSRRMARALSARCVSRVDGIPIRVLSIGETVRLLRGMPVESLRVMLDESVVVVLELGGVVVVVVVAAALSVCWLCVGVGAAAPVPSCWDAESVVVVDVGGVVVVVELLDEFIDVESVVVVEDGGVVVVDEGVDIDAESVVVEADGVGVVVVVEDDGVVVVVGVVVTSPVDVACDPSFETRM